MSYSDDGEDLDILDRFPEGYQGTAVEVGAADGKSLSNTLLLEEKGWNVLCIEPNPDFEAELKATRKNVVMAACLASEGEEDLYTHDSPGSPIQGKVSTVGPVSEKFWTTFCNGANEEPVVRKIRVATLDSLLADWPHQDPIDFISIDVDGREPEVLAGFDFDRWAPRYMLIEDIVGGPDTVIAKAMQEHGYQRIGLFGWNQLWTRRAD